MSSDRCDALFFSDCLRRFRRGHDQCVHESCGIGREVSLDTCGGCDVSFVGIQLHAEERAMLE
jgi:hypothetical protein